MTRTPLSGLAASTIRSREDLLFTIQQVSDNTSTLQTSTNVVLCWFYRGWCFHAVPCAAVPNLTYSFVSFLVNCAFVTRTN